VLDGFDPNSYLDHAARYRATHANVVPTMLTMLVNDEHRFRKGAGSLTSVIYGASPMPRPTIERALDMWGPIFTQYYGQTEAPLAIATLSPRDHVNIDAPLGACGQPAVDVDVRVVDEAGGDVQSGAIGEIVVRGPMVHAGYRNAPELDDEARMADGFMRTRDLGHFDDRGFLHLADRTSEMIISGGYNVYPREVEAAVEAHPAVMECAVVGAPDDKWVEAVTAFIVERQGQHVSDDALVAFVRQRLAGYKVPRRIERCETLPKSAVGKVLRRALRDPLWEKR
jgi:acyl-CoA synthetase (AMP-forming)/AMP-acid ligase II